MKKNTNSKRSKDSARPETSDHGKKPFDKYSSGKKSEQRSGTKAGRKDAPAWSKDKSKSDTWNKKSTGDKSTTGYKPSFKSKDTKGDGEFRSKKPNYGDATKGPLRFEKPRYGNTKDKGKDDQDKKNYWQEKPKGKFNAAKPSASKPGKFSGESASDSNQKLAKALEREGRPTPSAEGPTRGGERPKYDDRKPPQDDKGRSYTAGKRERTGDESSDYQDRKTGGNKGRFDQPRERNKDESRSFQDKKQSGDGKERSERTPIKGRSDHQERGPRKEYGKPSSRTPYEGDKAPGGRKKNADYEKKSYGKKAGRDESGSGDFQKSIDIRLNRFIANAGVCSRRDADLLIQAGEIRVNGKPITEMGYKVKRTDEVKYGNKLLNWEKPVYVLLNKPKDFITTTSDPEDRKTIMNLVANACDERIYPVGRLDRHTTGLLLLTNDGELAEKLAHPSHGVKKLYQVDIDKPITDEDFLKIQAGVELEDGVATVDEIAIVTPDRTSLGLQIHIGKNRIVRRIFEQLGYEVVKLDRVMYAGLDKKDLPRGKWRFLSEKEVIRLKYLK